MKKLIATIAVAAALSFAGPIVASDGAFAAKSGLKTCSMGKGKKAQTWKCEAGQTCCVTPEGKGVCGIAGLGCL